MLETLEMDWSGQVETIKTDVIVFMGIIHDNLKSH
jgi:hypothetical protein